ncbi:RT0821/Lpp0805 family surface protein [Methylocapsa palsarum]|uniref:RT0821/Lpp0805 family surface protein n=1 Tax=Methylocapsa palsarum TaxID=1612308 RepID=UPI001FCD3BFF|nr:RT0821/Lpp0805 family surface protein [Methylocapsa palsarum]
MCWRAGAAACLALTLAGCAVSMPIASLSASRDDATGAIPEAVLVRQLDAEDWRRARAALSTALDLQGNGLPVAWDNPASGAKGSFTPSGKAYSSDARVCRAFAVKLDRKGEEQSMRGTACSAQGADWSITELKPAQKTLMAAS